MGRIKQRYARLKILDRLFLVKPQQAEFPPGTSRRHIAEPHLFLVGSPVLLLFQPLDCRFRRELPVNEVDQQDAVIFQPLA